MINRTINNIGVKKGTFKSIGRAVHKGTFKSVIGTSMELDPDVVRWANALQVKPSKQYLIDLSVLVFRLRNCLIWDRLDRFFLHATEERSHALIDVKNLGVASEQGTLTWTKLRGYKSNGTNGYLKSGYNPGDGLQTYNLTRNVVGIGGYLLTEQANDNQVICGAVNAGFSGNILIPRRAANTTYYQINDATGNNGPQTTSLALTTGLRISSTGKNCYNRGIVVQAVSVASQAVPNVEFYMLAYNNNGVAAGFSTNTHALTFLGGDGVSGADQLEQYNAIQEFALKQGFAV
jgi:hypothetical protein